MPRFGVGVEIEVLTGAFKGLTAKIREVTDAPCCYGIHIPGQNVNLVWLREEEVRPAEK
jgi:hypothetical protein